MLTLRVYACAFAYKRTHVCKHKYTIHPSKRPLLPAPKTKKEKSPAGHNPEERPAPHAMASAKLLATNPALSQLHHR